MAVGTGFGQVFRGLGDTPFRQQSLDRTRILTHMYNCDHQVK